MKKYLKINETALAVIVLLIIGTIFVVFNQQKKPPVQSYEMPVLNLPLRYFPDSDFSWSRYIISGDMDRNTLTEARMNSGYRSFPTTTIELSSSGYSVEHRELPPARTLAQISKEDADWEYSKQWVWLYKKQIQEYGNLATRFLLGSNITNLEKFDVDGDGKPETVVYICGTGGNHCPHEIIIIKDNTIIFSVSEGLTGLDLVKSETGNGFYVHWVPLEDGTKWDTGLCCPPGYVSTRFVYENGKFKPVYEQEILYFEVKNTERY